MDYHKNEECVRRLVYKLKSRNLNVGVYNGKNGFIGIRTKFSSEFLDVEYHYDTDPHYGTAKPIEVIGVIPDWIPIEENLGTICANCGRPCIAIPVGDTPTPVKWEHIPWQKFDRETGDVLNFDFGDCDVRPTSLPNPYLFDKLREFEKVG